MMNSTEVWIVVCEAGEFWWNYSAHLAKDDAQAMRDTMERSIGGDWHVVRILPMRMEGLPEGQSVWRIDQNRNGTWVAWPLSGLIEDEGFENDVDYLGMMFRMIDDGEAVIAESEEEAIRMAEEKHRGHED